MKAVGRGIGARPGLRAFSVSLEATHSGNLCAIPMLHTQCDHAQSPSGHPQYPWKLPTMSGVVLM